MRSRLTKLAAALTALTALAVGGSSLASAAQKGATPTPPAAEVASSTADGDNVQQGDQAGIDTAGSQSEQAASESGQSDGPGGYADANANADTQQQGEN